MSDSGPTDTDVKEFREKYPALTFELESERELRAQYIEAGIPEASDSKNKTSLSFTMTQVLLPKLTVTEGFKSVRFHDSAAAVGCVSVTP
jgi:hypothetical protein